MNMQKKRLACVLILIAICLGVWAGAGFLRVLAEEREVELLLPSSREEYLPLERPLGASFSDKFFAIADGNYLYLYKREAREYVRYEHFGTTGEPCDISAVNFTFDGKLFFADSETHLFRYDLTKNAAELIRDLPCASFAVAGDTLYFSAVATTGTTVYAVSHNALSFDKAEKVGEIVPGAVPRLFAEGNRLFCAVESLVHIYERADGGFSHSQQLLAGSTPVSGLTAICSFRDRLYFADESGLYLSADQKQTILSKEGVKSLSVYGDCLYVTIDGEGVREATIGGDGELIFTGYEIAGSSSSFNRLSEANALATGGDLLVCADKGNDRVLVRDRQSNEYFSLNCGSAQAVATDGAVIAAAVSDRLYLYRKGETEPYYQETAPGSISGVSVILGKCYYATETSFCEAWEGGARRTSGISCVALAGDLLGNLYAVDAGGAVTKYREDDFAYGGGTVLDYTISPSFRSLGADFEGNLYYLIGNEIYKNGAFYAAVPEFAGDTPVAISAEVRSDALLLEYETYILRVSGSGVPVLDGIVTSNLRDRVFSVPASGEIAALDIPEGLPGILTELGSLKSGAGTFPCKEVKRTKGGTGVLLGRTQNYVLCALYEEYDYPVYLLPAECVTEREPRREEPTAAEQFTLNETKLLGYPCLADELGRESLPRAFHVTVLDVLKFDNGFGFAYVETADGLRGYLPTNLLSAVEPTEREPESYRLGYLKSSGDGVLFRTNSGETMTVHERRQVRIYDSGDGRYMVAFDENDMTYTAQVTGAMLENGSTNMIRISIIIVLCVVAVGLCAIYVILIRPKKKR